MKIVHLCLACFYPDGYSYQENMLPKYHKKMGYEVEVIASLVTFDKNGKGTYLNEAKTYKNEYDILVKRLAYKKPTVVYKKLNRFLGLSNALECAKPDILFIHGCQFKDIDIVVEYLKKHENVKVFVDNHADFSNSATNFLSKNILHKIIWRRCAHLIKNRTECFYGVLPARVDFLKQIYKLPADKCELLVMGADDDKIVEITQNGEREKIRQQYNISSDDFLIMTGGKIDTAKKQTLYLMEAVKKIADKHVKLIVFGSVIPELKADVERLCLQDKVIYAGWISSEDSYKYFAAADLVVFPGRHSVFWEQVAAQGIPMICKYWEGTTHIDIGGNVLFLEEDSTEEIAQKIEDVRCNYESMLAVAKGKGRKLFYYSEIAKQSIQK